jgi:hypothetical protein
MYDYGSAELNAKYYNGETKPPKYPLENLKDWDIALICGKSDKLAAPEDYNILK